MDQTSGGSKKGLYIVIGILVLVILGFLMRDSLGFTRKYEVGGMNGEVTKKIDGSTTVKSDYGTVTNSNTVPENWPSDVPTYSNSTITGSVALDPTYSKISGTTLMFTTSDNVESVLAFYNKELIKNGWSITGSGSTTVGASTMLSAKKDSRMISLVITNGSKINVTLSVSNIPNSAINTTPIAESKDSQLKSNLSNMRAQGELYYDKHSNSYKGFCNSIGMNFTCNDTSASWSAGAQLTTGVWCVDSTGFTGSINSLPKGTSCK